MSACLCQCSQLSMRIRIVDNRSAGSQVASFLLKFLHFIKYSVLPISDKSYLLFPYAPEYFPPQTSPHPFSKQFLGQPQALQSLCLSLSITMFNSSSFLFSLFLFVYKLRQIGKLILWLLLNEYWLQSIMNCSRNYFRNQNGVCEPCSLGCNKCYETTYCVSCRAGFSLQNGQCRYSITLPSGIIPVILIVMAVATLLLYLLIFHYMPYLRRKKEQYRIESRKLVSPFRIAKKISEESVFRTPPEEEPETAVSCPLCLKSEVNVRTQCGHLFHQSCLLDWTENEDTCPTCKDKNLNPLKFYCYNCKQIYGGKSSSGAESAKDLIFHRCKNSDGSDKEAIFT